VVGASLVVGAALVDGAELVSVAAGLVVSDTAAGGGRGRIVVAPGGDSRHGDGEAESGGTAAAHRAMLAPGRYHTESAELPLPCGR
jgi:hypothetical protein